MYEIRVGLIKTERKAVYIGPPSPLANPYANDRSLDHDQQIDAYADWFYDQLDARNRALIKQLRRCHHTGIQDNLLILGCFCYPRRCHGDVIRQYFLTHYHHPDFLYSHY